MEKRGDRSDNENKREILLLFVSISGRGGELLKTVSIRILFHFPQIRGLYPLFWN